MRRRKASDIRTSRWTTVVGVFTAVARPSVRARIFKDLLCFPKLCCGQGGENSTRQPETQGLRKEPILAHNGRKGACSHGRFPRLRKPKEASQKEASFRCLAGS